MYVTVPSRVPSHRRIISAFLGIAIITTFATACGGYKNTSDASPTRAPTAAVATLLVTAPPGRTAAPAGSAPSARTPETVTTVARTTPIVVAAPTVAAPTTAPPTATSQAQSPGSEVAPGMQLFTNNGCIACHGADLRGGIGPSLAGRTPDDLTEDRIRTQIANGGNGMPPFPALGPAEINVLIALIRSS